MREKVNAWMRGSAEFNAVVDFGEVLRDPVHPRDCSLFMTAEIICIPIMKLCGRGERGRIEVELNDQRSKRRLVSSVTKGSRFNSGRRLVINY